MPTFFVMVAIGLGRVDSIEALNGDLTDAVNAAARAAATVNGPFGPPCCVCVEAGFVAD